MKVASYGVDLQPGKYKYKCKEFNDLVEKFSPQKTVAFGVECIGEDLEKADAIIYAPEKKFDFTFIDLEKIDKRLERTDDDKEKEFLKKCQKLLEEETLLCDVDFDAQEVDFLKPLAFVTRKPSVAIEDTSDINTVIKKVLDISKTVLFFTAGKKEVHAWDLKKGQTALDAAGTIHSDLARGFIKAEVVNISQLDNFFNMAEARSKGLVKMVDKGHVIEHGDIIEIRFNV